MKESPRCMPDLGGVIARLIMEKCCNFEIIRTPAKNYELYIVGGDKFIEQS